MVVYSRDMSAPTGFKPVPDFHAMQMMLTVVSRHAVLHHLGL